MSHGIVYPDGSMVSAELLGSVYNSLGTYRIFLSEFVQACALKIGTDYGEAWKLVMARLKADQGCDYINDRIISDEGWDERKRESWRSFLEATVQPDVIVE